MVQLARTGFLDLTIISERTMPPLNVLYRVSQQPPRPWCRCYMGRLLTGNVVALHSGLTAVESKLGWTVFGKQKFCRKDKFTTTLPMHVFTCRNCGGGDRGRVAIYRPFGEVSLSLNRTVTCMVLKANDRRTSCPRHDEFRGPRSDYVRHVALATTTTTTRGGTACE
ncbi:uncharacterized protein TNCV_1768961 [Trichonephila clavipes]|nr:uncharacterized protein TNCV_1768961 [Trichonephila clavipes]